MDKKIDNLHYSISRPAQQLVHQEEEHLEEECLTDTILGEEAQLQLQLQKGLKEEPAEDHEELQDVPQLCVIYGPWKKEEEILPLLSEESNGKEAGEEPQKSTAQPQNSPLTSVYSAFPCNTIHTQNTYHNHINCTACPTKIQEISGHCTSLCHFIKNDGSRTYRMT